MLKRILKAAMCLASGLASRLIPRTDNVWVFGGNRGLRFADNSMYFYKYCCRHSSRKNIWLTRSTEILEQLRSAGYRAHRTYSLLGLWYGFRAKWHIFDVGVFDTNSYSSCGARQLNLWHGYPIKDFRNFRFNAKNESNGFIRTIWEWICNTSTDNGHHNFVHQNKKYLWQITEAFDVSAENVIIANYPRNVVFEESDDALRDISVTAKPWIEKLAQIRTDGNQVIGYFPTWRGDENDKFMGTRDLKEIHKLNGFLAANDLFIATKWHTCVFNAYHHNGRCTAAEKLNETMNSLSNIVVLGFEQDLNSLLGQCDALISDYSGVIVDFLLSDRPQIFLAYDLEEYRQKPGFVFDYEDFIPGPMAQTMDLLVSILSEYAAEPDVFAQRFAEQRKALRKDLFDDLEGSAKIIEFMESVARIKGL